MRDLKYVTNAEIAYLIDSYIHSERDIPEGMQTLYDYLHDRHIKWARKIKARQDEYLKGV